jgi:phage tail sheath protein FI
MQTPGIIREDIFAPPRAALETGIPAFIGFASAGAVNMPKRLTLWTDFEAAFGAAREGGYLAAAIRGFFENGGRACTVVRQADVTDLLSPVQSLLDALDALSSLDSIDLVCAPDIVRTPKLAVELQQLVAEHCMKSGDRFAILDCLPGLKPENVLEQTYPRAANAAVYYPWLKDVQGSLLPPCGHVAGVYARTDQQTGVFKAPANAVIEGVVDLEFRLDDRQQAPLNQAGVNVIRAFSGRGIRVWGARTLSDQTAWQYVNVRRLFLTAGRWVERNLAGASFEPNTPALWATIERELTACFTDWFQRGALRGQTPAEAFYVRCNADTNPPEVIGAGLVVTEIGLAPALPNEFVIVRIIHGASGVSLVGPTPPAA